MDTYKINEQEYPVTFNFNTIRMFCKNNGIASLNDFDLMLAEKPEKDVTITDIENRVALILEGIREGCRMEKQPCALTIDDLFAEMSQNPRFITDMMSVFNETQPPASTEVNEMPAHEIEGKKKV